MRSQEVAQPLQSSLEASRRGAICRGSPLSACLHLIDVAMIERSFVSPQCKVPLVRLEVLITRLFKFNGFLQARLKDIPLRMK